MDFEPAPLAVAQQPHWTIRETMQAEDRARLNAGPQRDSGSYGDRPSEDVQMTDPRDGDQSESGFLPLGYPQDAQPPAHGAVPTVRQQQVCVCGPVELMVRVQD